MLESLIFDSQGQAWLNSLRRFVQSGVLVPSQENLVINVPAATSPSNSGRSNTIAIQGPEDAKSECYSLVGVQGVQNAGMGLITIVGVALTGSGTKFTQQLQAGSVIQVPGGAGTVVSIQSDTAATLAAGAPAVAGVNFSFSTPVLADVRDRMTCTIEDTAWRRMLMNRDVPVRHVFGSQQYPLFMAESMLLEVDQTILVRLLNNSMAGPGSLAPVIEFRKWQVEALKRPGVGVFIDGLRQRKMFLQPYWLTLDNLFTHLAPGGSATQFFSITGDITAVLMNLYGHAISTGVVGDIQEMVELEFFDATNGRALQVQPLTLNTACGTAETPFILPQPMIAEPARQIGVKLRNLILDMPTDVYLTFHGVAVYTGMAGRGSALTEMGLQTEARQIYKALEPQVVAAGPQG